MNDVEVTIENGRIYVRSPFKLKDMLKEIPTAKWDGISKRWNYTAAPLVALALAERLGATGDDQFVALVKQATVQRAENAAVKRANNLPQPEVRKLDAWNHQLQAYHFSRNKTGALLALEMGVGKTKVTIDIIQNRGDKLVLVLCPKKVVQVWPSEMEKHCAVPYRILALDDGTTTERTNQAASFLRQPSDELRMIVTNYETAASESFSKWALKRVWDCVVADESHRLKSPSGVQSRTVAAIGAQAKHRLALTGTPLPHSPLDAYAQYRFLDRSIFGSNYTVFRNRYAIMGGYQGYELLGFRNTEDFNKRFYSIAIKVGKEVLDLPPYHHINRYCTLEKDARGHYKSLEDDFVAYLDGADGPPVTAANTLVKLLRLQQLTGGHLDHRTIDTSKADLLAEVLDEIDGHEPVVVFANFIDDLDAIRNAAAKECSEERIYFELSGRVNELEQWRACPTGAVLGVQMKAGGVGIDLTKAAYCIYYSTGYSLGDYQQSEARVHRPGQTRATTYVHLISRGTIDETVAKALADKKAVVDAILEELR